MSIGNSLLNYFYFFVGMCLLLLVKFKHKALGYRTPKPFSTEEVDRCIDYDWRTVDDWLKYLAEYTGERNYLGGRHVLELGPGSDLGVGLILLANGARKYSAVDANNLAGIVTQNFYDRLFDRLSEKHDVADLRKESVLSPADRSSRLNYVVRADFNLEIALAGEGVDVIFSQAAFEHFEDVDTTIRQLSRISAPDTVLVMTVDLQTHTRWIREKDPNNIYRFPSWLYKWFHFSGIPNRVRPDEYRAAFLRHGWTDLHIRPLMTLPEDRLDVVQPYLYGRFKQVESDMNYLTMLFCARRSSKNSD